MNVEINYDDFEDSVPVLTTKHTKYQGIVGCLGPTMPLEELKQQFITINISPKQPMQLNKGVKRRWGDYTVAEQVIIITRYQHFLKTISDTFEIHYEFTKDLNIHIHCIVNTRSNSKDIRINSKRFFSIPSQNVGFVDTRPVTDYESLILYLTNKTEKKYQTTGIMPLCYKPILI